MNGRRMKKYGHLFKSCERFQFKQYFQKIEEEGKIILEPRAIIETRTRQLRNRSISSGRTYLLKIQHGRTRILYKKHQELLKR